MMSEQDSEDNLPKGKLEVRISDRLAEQRTTLAFQRTRLAADRTLMGIIRTSLSLIGFGFTIFQFTHSLKSLGLVKKDLSVIPEKPGLILVELGICLLVLGIIYHINFMLQVRKERKNLQKEGLIIPTDTFPISMTLIIGVLLLMFGLFVIVKMIVYPGG